MLRFILGESIFYVPILLMLISSEERPVVKLSLDLAKSTQVLHRFILQKIY